MIELCLASIYTEKINPSGWYASDKLDGVRCFWTGKEMYTRNGRLLKLPPFFLAELPASPLDGEMYIPENILSALSKGKSIHGLKFDPHQEKIVKDDFDIQSEIVESKTKFSPSSILSSIVCSTDCLGWTLMTYWVFDAPAISMPFKHRLSSLQTYFSSASKVFVKLIDFSPVKDTVDVKDRLKNTKMEGLILRNPNAMYERKRCWSMVKVKTLMDAEFEVVDTCLHPYGKNPNRREKLKASQKGRYAIILRTMNPDKKQFVLVNGVTKMIQEECLRAKSSGNLVTVRFNGYDRKGIPRQPVFLRTHLSL